MLGFPIRKSSDLSSVDSSPRLIAASYVLHRLLVPRHPPYALTHLLTKMLASTVQFSNNTPVPNRIQGPRPPRGWFHKRSGRIVFFAWKERLFFQDPTVCRYIHRGPGQSRHLGAMKLASVPPMSFRGPTDGDTNGLWHNHFHLCEASCRSAP